MATLPREVDTLVLGGGTTGSVVAGLLAERSAGSVLVLEAGPDYGPHDSGRWPGDLLNAAELGRSHEWGLTSERTYADRVVPFQRARVIGGCSSHNGCAAIWGHRADYDALAAATGESGWSTGALQPLFAAANRRMRVVEYRASDATPFHAAALQAAAATGIPIGGDLNDLDDPVRMALSPSNVPGGTRWNAAFAYLDPVRHQGNLRIVGGMLVDRLILDGDRVAGAVAVGPDGPVEIRAGRTIVAGGTYGSPAILLRSGIGAADELRAVGVTPRHELPGVGRNLHDHPAISLEYAGSPALIAAMETFERDHWMPEEQTIAKLRSSRCAEAFDLHMYPVGGRTTAGNGGWSWLMWVACMTPRSRGSLRLRSADPAVAPLIDHRYLGDPDGHDRAVLRDGMAIVRDLAGPEPLASLLGAEVTPGPAASDNAALDRYLDRNVSHYYHPVGTCAMGTDRSAGAVVDGRGRIHGLRDGYVADCAILPTVPRANTNIPAVVVGERIAGWLLGES